MSLDVDLVGDEKEVECICPLCSTSHMKKEKLVFYSWNITHNLNKMAQEAGIYRQLWRPDEIGITKAKDLIDPLTVALIDLKQRPAFYKRFNPKNGWGNYEGLVEFVETYLKACIENPEATIEVSR